ncbi:MAG: MFS transporter [Candidatus Dormibacteraeota bacterium]|nr:MFS transporter [Candidatus Dormibacteraeota bacterium]
MVQREEASGRRTFRVLLGALPLQFAFGLVYAWGAIAPFVRHDLHWSALLISAVFSATPAGYGTGIVIGGRIADRTPPRRLCWVGLALMSVGLLVALTIPSGPAFVFLYSMLGLGLGGGLALAGSIAAGRYALPGREGMAGGLVTGAYAIAAPIQVPLISVLASAFGWLATLRMAGALVILIAASTLALMPAIPAPPARHSSAATPQPSTLTLLRRPRIFTAILLEIVTTPLGAYAFVNVSTYARDIALAAVVATAAITAVAIGNAIGRIAGGTLSDRWGVDKLMLALVVLDAAAGVVLYFHPSGLAIIAAALLAGLGFGAPAGVVSRLSQDAAPDAPNSAFGLIFVGFAVGAGGGSLLGAAVGGAPAWLALGLLALAGTVVIALRLRLSPESGR